MAIEPIVWIDISCVISEGSGVSWTWESLRESIAALGLTPGHYVAGVDATYLANGELVESASAELLVDDWLYQWLAGNGWIADGDRLRAPDRSDLWACTGPSLGPYTAGLPQLIAAAEDRDGIPVVPLQMIDREADRARRGAQLAEVMARMQRGENVDRADWPRLPKSDPRGRSVRRKVGLVVVGFVLLGSVGVAAILMAQFGGWKHVAGQTQEVEATVTGLNVTRSSCRDDHAVYYDYAWEIDGQQRTATERSCENLGRSGLGEPSYAVGDRRTVWVDGDDIVETSSPLVARVGIAGVVIVMLGFFVYLFLIRPKLRRSSSDRGGPGAVRQTPSG